MRVSVPFTYKVTAVPYKHQNEATLMMVENMWVEVPDIEPEDLDLAMVVRDLEGNEVERIYGHAGQTWVKDSRDAQDLPFYEQHLWVADREKFRFRDDKLELDSQLKDVVILGSIGILRAKTALYFENSYALSQSFYDSDEGVMFLEKTVESEKARKVRTSDRDKRMERARRIAQDYAIAVNGELYYRVSEPCLIVTDYYGRYAEVKWRFGCPDFVTDTGARQNSGYPVSAKDFGRINEFFSAAGNSIKGDFSCEVHDDRYFTLAADKIALVADAQRIVNDELHNSRPTAFILKWCQLRDHLEGMWNGSEGRVAFRDFLSRDDFDFNTLAGYIEEIDAIAPDIGAKGLRMWDSRLVSPEIRANAPQP